MGGMREVAVLKAEGGGDVENGDRGNNYEPLAV